MAKKATKKQEATPAAPKKSASKKAPAAKAKPAEIAAKLVVPTGKELEKRRQQDEGYVLAGTDIVEFLKGRQQAVFNVARRYHLEPDELFQEAYEVLLTCLRDFSPVIEKKDGTVVEVQFTTFFGSRLETKAMEMRNGDPEYKARQAHLNDMSDEEKARFREDPALLVQHLDQESPMQEMLRGETSKAKDDSASNPALKIAQDSFFEKKLTTLIRSEKDEKKRAILMQIKVGGVFNFQEMAYQFGVTDSRASQVLNELIDAFYVQRLLNGNVSSVAYDFKKLRFNDKRSQRLVLEALQNAPAERTQQILATFEASLPDLMADYAKVRAEQQPVVINQQQAMAAAAGAPAVKPPPLAYESVLTPEENEKFPLIEVAMRSLADLRLMNEPYRAPLAAAEEERFTNEFETELNGDYPILITQDGMVIDGQRRLRAAKTAGANEYLCIVREVPDYAAAVVLRVAVNLRLNQPDKLDLYHAICTLAEQGLSQQKIANVIGLSRTNVIVYCKVKDKAAPKLRALFEDGLIQITNAAGCVDLPSVIQEELAEFIRKYGQGWSKGAKFNELFAAAQKGKIAALAKDQKPAQAAVAVPEASSATTAVVADSAVTQGLQQRVTDYEQALQDSEVWLAQREQVISRQTEALSEAQQEIEQLKRELDAAELMKFGNKKDVEAELAELRRFLAVAERLTSAKYGLDKAINDLPKLSLRRSQQLELQELEQDLLKLLNQLRIVLQ